MGLIPAAFLPMHCFHCGLPVPADSAWRLEVLGAEQPFCCPGCREVARTVVEAGLSEYYEHRTRAAGRADPDVVPDILKRLALYDHPDVQRSFVRAAGGHREASLILEDVRCAACVWLNEQHLRRQAGVVEVEVDYGSQRARVVWDPEQTRLSDILRAVTDIGYVAHPYDPAHREQLLRDRHRRDWSRILFAAVAGMPVMQFNLRPRRGCHRDPGALGGHRPLDDPGRLPAGDGLLRPGLLRRRLA
jgi:Cu2+-exporting ATPase